MSSGAAPIEEAPLEADTPSETDPSAAPSSAAQSRALAEQASYADLLDVVRDLDGRGAERTSSPCLIRRDAERWRLDGNLALSIRPLPATSPLARVPESGPVRVFSRWGQQGSGWPVLVAYTDAPPPEAGAAYAVLVRGEEVLLRATDGSQNDRVRAGAGRGAGAEFAGWSALPPPARVFVTAEPEVSVARLVRVLGALPTVWQSRVVLAVTLARDTALPNPPPRGEGDAGLCHSMEPLPPAPEGSLPVEALRTSVSALASAISCLENAGPESAQGGVVRVEITVGPGGEVLRACALDDEIGDSGVRSCLLDQARALRFPDPGGQLTLALPLRLVPDRSDIQQAYCPQ